jgi:pilus assembly protein CpaB
MAVADQSGAVGVGAHAEPPAAQQSRRLLMISLLLAAAGVALLALYVRRYETEASGGQRVQLLAVLSPIPRGTVLKSEMLGVREVPVSYVEQRAVRAAELSKVTGIQTALDLDPQDGLLWTDLAVGVEDRDLSSLVQPGNRAVTIEVQQGLSGAAGNELIRPGDWVDVLATYSERSGAGQAGSAVVLLQRVAVLAVGNETDRQAFRASDSPKNATRMRSATLTLSLKIDEAQLVALAAKQGELSVVLRSVKDSTVLDGIPGLKPSSLEETAAQVNRRRNAGAEDSSPKPILGNKDYR